MTGYNLYYGWYYGEKEGLQQRLDAFHAQNPGVPVLVSEYGVDTNPAYHTYAPKAKDYTEEYQLSFCDNALRAFAQRPFGEPFVKLAGSRFVHRHQEKNDVTVLSNLTKLELALNGAVVAVCSDVQPMTVFPNVCLSMGKNQVLVRGWDKNGQIWEDRMDLVRTAEADPSYLAPQKPDGRALVANWFEKLDLSGPELTKLDPACYSTKDTLEVLLKDERSAAVVMKFLGPLLKDPRFRRAGEMSVSDLAKIPVLRLPKELVPAMDRELNQIPIRPEEKNS